MGLKITKRVTESQAHSLTLTDEDLIALLNKAGLDIPDGAVVTVAVPGGGDWSNTDLHIEDYRTIDIDWTTTTEYDAHEHV